jgi:hypothetical protein
LLLGFDLGLGMIIEVGIIYWLSVFRGFRITGSLDRCDGNVDSCASLPPSPFFSPPTFSL